MLGALRNPNCVSDEGVRGGAPLYFSKSMEGLRGKTFPAYLAPSFLRYLKCVNFFVREGALRIKEGIWWGTWLDKGCTFLKSLFKAFREEAYPPEKMKSGKGVEKHWYQRGNFGKCPFAKILILWFYHLEKHSTINHKWIITSSISLELYPWVL